MENEVIDEAGKQGTEGAPPEGAPAEGQQQEQKPEAKVPDWAVRRFGELTATRKLAESRAEAAERERDELRRQVAAGGGEGAPTQQATPQNIEQLARAYAENIAAGQRHADQLQSIDQAGKKEFGAEYDKSVDNLRMAGVGGAQFLEVLTSVPNPEKIVQYLGQADNLEEAIRVASLNPVQMAVELVKLAPKAAKAFAKPVSNAPAPITPISGGGADEGTEPRVGTPEWFTWRNKNARRKR